MLTAVIVTPPVLPRILSVITLALDVILPVAVITPAVDRLPTTALPEALRVALDTAPAVVILPPVIRPVALTAPPVDRLPTVAVPVADTAPPVETLPNVPVPVALTKPTVIKLPTSALPDTDTDVRVPTEVIFGCALFVTV